MIRYFETDVFPLKSKTFEKRILEEEFSKVLHNIFFNFIMDSEIPEDICSVNNVLIPITFLKKELKLFKTRLITNEDKVKSQNYSQGKKKQ